MFGRLFKTQLKVTLHDRTMVFWTILFPLILGTMFYFAFSNLSSIGKIEPISVAVVNNDSYQANQSLNQSLKSLSNGESKILEIQKVKTSGEGVDLLNEQKVTGLIESIDETAKVTVKGTDSLNETIVKTAVEQSIQINSSITDALTKNPQTFTKLNQIGTTNYLKNSTESSGDMSVIYFYTLIGMACIYASFFGIYAVNRIEANQSKLAMRLAVSPVSKAKALLAGLSSGYLVALLGQILLYFYLTAALGVDFGDNSLAVFAVMVVGSLAGVMLGAFVGIASSKSENTKINILLAISMAGSLLAGMMGTSTIKYMIDQHLPILGLVNPVNLISDALFATYYFGVGDRYWLNLTCLGIFIVATAIATWFISRRKSYASL